MKVSTKGRYAVMALVDIAVHGGGQQGFNQQSVNQGGSRPVSLADVAHRQDISLSYLEQLFARLRRAGLVRSVRGPGGGYLLGRPAASIPVAEVVQAVEEAPRPLTAANAPASTASARALTQSLWDGLGSQIRNYLAGITLADVVGPSRVTSISPSISPPGKRSAA